MRNLFDIWGSRVAPLRLVLIIDQFEELFTLFVHEAGGAADAGPV